WLVEWNRANWTTQWNDLKPELARVRGPNLVQLALPEAGYFAGHVVAAGNPVDPSVRSQLPDDVESARPKYLAVMLTPGSESIDVWLSKEGAKYSRWGYQTIVQARSGVIFERRGNSE